MFHVYIENNIHVIPCDSEHVNAVAVNDDIENLYLYNYDAEENKIYKRVEIDYSIEERDIPYIKFNTHKRIELSIGFYKGEVFKEMFVEVERYDVSDEHTGHIKETVEAEIGLDLSVDGMVYISSNTKDVYFEPIEIHIEDKVNNEENPKIYVENQILVVEPSDNYRRLVILQTALESTQKTVSIMQEEIRTLKGGK